LGLRVRVSGFGDRVYRVWGVSFGFRIHGMRFRIRSMTGRPFLARLGTAKFAGEFDALLQRLYECWGKDVTTVFKETS